eukprot:CAMPEP_0179126972 /NCGR_PEP_ID=MMETSP0796-20121207/60128_1 /TAXON_ID=73915 /ORGANISM="Pyrodinium bahamense, Strain pbaha01" /LENGTH=30 /DNA_ID= /DNA_START= /DNA_END= /DNA_ORIENTATION=
MTWWHAQSPEMAFCTMRSATSASGAEGLTV